MAVTRAQIEAVLIRRCGVKMAYAQMDNLTTDGTNPDLDDPLSDGLASLGVAVAGLAVADSDLLAVDSVAARQLIDVAELRVLESVLGNKSSPDSKSLNSYSYEGRLYNNMEKTVARKRDQVEKQYGIGVPTVVAGVIDLGIAETIDQATGIPD